MKYSQYKTFHQWNIHVKYQGAMMKIRPTIAHQVPAFIKYTDDAIKLYVTVRQTLFVCTV